MLKRGRGANSLPLSTLYICQAAALWLTAFTFFQNLHCFLVVRYLPSSFFFFLAPRLWLNQSGSPHTHNECRLKSTLISCYQHLGCQTKSALMHGTLITFQCWIVLEHKYRGGLETTGLVVHKTRWPRSICRNMCCFIAKRSNMVFVIVFFFKSRAHIEPFLLDVAWQQGSAVPKLEKPWCFA